MEPSLGDIQGDPYALQSLRVTRQRLQQRQNHRAMSMGYHRHADGPLTTQVVASC